MCVSLKMQMGFRGKNPNILFEVGGKEGETTHKL